MTSKALKKGHPTSAVIRELRNVETPMREIGIHPKDKIIRVDTSGEQGQANVRIYTDGSKTENHVGAGVIVEKDSKEIYTGVKRLNSNCSVFQAELCGILMAVEWIERQTKDSSSYAVHSD